MSSTDTSGKASETADAAKQSGEAVAGSAADHAKDFAETASDRASDVLDDARSQASDLLETVRDQIGSEAETRRGQAVSSLRVLGDELDSMRSHDGDHGVATDLAGRGGEYARQTADWLDGRQPSEILDDVRRFARERPGTFLLGALLAGVVAGRLTRAVKAGEPMQPSTHADTPRPRHQQAVDASAPSASQAPRGGVTEVTDPAGYEVDSSGYPPVTDDLGTPLSDRSGVL